MPERAGREGDSQPLPTVNDSPDIQSLVIRDIEERRELGIRRYGTALQPQRAKRHARSLRRAVGCCHVRKAVACGVWRFGSVRKVSVEVACQCADGFGCPHSHILQGYEFNPSTGRFRRKLTGDIRIWVTWRRRPISRSVTTIW